MKTIALENSFGAPVYYAECVSSTMTAARSLAASGAPSGSVVVAEFQEQGRGRIGRSWEAERGSALLFTLLLRYPGLDAMPQALTLRAGLALALAIEEFAPALRAELKWPNDIMLGGKKAAGILTEADEKTVYIGVGINVSQREFPPGLQSKATSIALALGGTPERNAVPLEGAGQDMALHAMDAGLTAPYSRFTLLVKILHAMRRELEAARPWRARLETRLYMNGKTVRFAPGGPDSALVIEGLLQGLGPGGEILIAAADGSEVKSFSSGELRIYG